MKFCNRVPSLLFVICCSLLSCAKPQGLKFTGFQNLSLQPLSFAESKISADIGIHNPNKYAIKVNQVDAKIAIMGKSVGTYQLDSLLEIPGKSDFVFPVSIKVSNGTLISNLLSLAAGDSVQYSLAGKVRAGLKLGMAEIPFSYSGHLSQRDFMRNPEQVK